MRKVHTTKEFSDQEQLHKATAGQPNAQFQRTNGAYICPPALRDALRVAQVSGMPLLLSGEPGSGKTAFAHFVAMEENLGQPLVYNVEETTTAKDLFYYYDTLGHYFYVRQKEGGSLEPREVEERFIHYNALGRGLLSGRRQLVLIDGIDKAPRTLPNGLLNAIDNMEFEVPEINKVGENRVRASRDDRPLIIFTSCTTFQLPEAFLRRCVFFHISFPGKSALIEIVKAKFPQADIESLSSLVEKALLIREQVNSKRISTAEIIDWIEYLLCHGYGNGKIEKNDRNSPSTLLASYSLLVKGKKDLLHLKRNPRLSSNL